MHVRSIGISKYAKPNVAIIPSVAKYKESVSGLVSNSLIDETETYQNDNCIKFETLICLSNLSHVIILLNIHIWCPLWYFNDAIRIVKKVSVILGLLNFKQQYPKGLSWYFMLS